MSEGIAAISIETLHHFQCGYGDCRKWWVIDDPPAGRKWLCPWCGRAQAAAVLHILQAGLPVCRFSVLVPAEWPIGHRWVGREEAHLATCTKCQEWAKIVAEFDQRLASLNASDVRERIEAALALKGKVKNRPKAGPTF